MLFVLFSSDHVPFDLIENLLSTERLFRIYISIGFGSIEPIIVRSRRRMGHNSMLIIMTGHFV